MLTIKKLIAPHARGVIARQLAPVPSNWRCEQSLESWMQTHQLVGISGWTPVPWCVTCVRWGP